MGALLLFPKNFQPVRLFLEEQFGKIRFRGVHRQEDGRLLVHLPPCVAASLNRGEVAVPNVVYLPGLRQTLSLPSLQVTDDSVFTFVELFSGIGGFRLGLESVGGACVLAVEKCPKATNIYRSYFARNGTLIEGDVMDLDLCDFSPYTMLCAGFPCQSFSNRGHQRGLMDGERGQMYLELVRILKDTKPSCFLFENVSQLVLIDGGSRGKRVKGKTTTFAMGRVLKCVINAFEACGYQVDWQVINSRHFTPQNRERVYIVGTRTDLDCPPFDWGKVQPIESSTATVRDILEPNDSPAVLASALSELQWNKVQSLRNQDDIFMNLDKKAPTLISQYRRVGSVSSKFVPTANGGGRFLTPRECCRIMGFPEDFPCDAPHIYTGIGNAVTPPLIAAIGRELIQHVQSK